MTFDQTIDQIRPAWRELYQTGLTASSRGDWNEAIRLFKSLLEKEPGFFVCREALQYVHAQQAANASLPPQPPLAQPMARTPAPVKTGMRARPSKRLGRA